MFRMMMMMMMMMMMICAVVSGRPTEAASTGCCSVFNIVFNLANRDESLTKGYHHETPQVHYLE